MHDTNLLEDQPIAWTPTPDVIERAQLTRFMKQVGVSTWDELYEFSIRDVEKFTEEVLKFLDIKFDPPYEKLMDVSEGVEFPVWFGGNADANNGTRTPSSAMSAAGTKNLRRMRRWRLRTRGSAFPRKWKQSKLTRSTRSSGLRSKISIRA